MNKENDRIKEIRKSLKLSQEGFGNAIGLTKSSISNIESGIRNVTEQHIRLICSEFDVNEDWLRTGEGEMFVRSETFSFDEQVKKSNLTELETAIMRGYMELSRDTREEIVSMLEGIILQRNESAASAEINIDAEVDSYRRELEAEKKARTSLASHEQEEKELG